MNFSNSPVTVVGNTIITVPGGDGIDAPSYNEPGGSLNINTESALAPPGPISITSGGTGVASIFPDGSTGAGKLRTAGGVTGATKESINRAFSYMLTKKNEMGIARELDVSDLHVEVIDLLNNRVEGEIGLGFFVAAISALKKTPSMAGSPATSACRETSKACAPSSSRYKSRWTTAPAAR